MKNIMGLFRLFKVRAKNARQVYREMGLIILLFAVVEYIQRFRRHLWATMLWFLTKYRFRNHLIEKNIVGNLMYLDPKDTGISKELAIYGIHEPVATQLLQNEIRKGDVVVDIGCNIGYYALIEARLVGKLGKVVAIEPNPQSMKIFQINLKKNDYNNVSTYQVAVGDENKITKLYLSHVSNWHSLIPTEYAPKGSIDVEMHTLDDLLRKEKQIDFVQMDIEGFEHKAINGMLKILGKFKPKMFIEIHADESVQQTLKTLNGLGYEIKYIIPRCMDFKAPISIVEQCRYRKRGINVTAGTLGIIEKMSIEEFLRDSRLLNSDFIVMFRFQG